MTGVCPLAQVAAHAAGGKIADIIDVPDMPQRQQPPIKARGAGLLDRDDVIHMQSCAADGSAAVGAEIDPASQDSRTLSQKPAAVAGGTLHPVIAYIIWQQAPPAETHDPFQLILFLIVEMPLVEADAVFFL